MRAPFLLLLVVLGIVATRAAPSRANHVAQTSVIAVVDLFEVLNTAKPFLASEEALKRWIEEEKGKLNVLREELAQKAADLELYQPGSAEHRQRSYELDVLKLQFEYRTADRERERQRRILDTQREAFDRARTACSEFAKARGIDLVLQVRRGELRGQTQAELTSEIFLHDVVHHSSSLDITGDVITLLDNR